jgi:hypothetical protein
MTAMQGMLPKTLRTRFWYRKADVHMQAELEPERLIGENIPLAFE